MKPDHSQYNTDYKPNNLIYNRVPEPGDDRRIDSAAAYSIGLGAVAAHIKMIPVQPVQITVLCLSQSL